MAVFMTIYQILIAATYKKVNINRKAPIQLLKYSDNSSKIKTVLSWVSSYNPRIILQSILNTHKRADYKMKGKICVDIWKIR